MHMRILGPVALIGLACALGVERPSAGGGCELAPDVDLVLSELTGISKWGTVGGVTGYSYGTTICNIGNGLEPFEALTPNHPVIAMNLYRWDGGHRFEQVGASWVKHTFASATAEFCCNCQDPGSSQILGIGCSDTYSAFTNGQQEGFNGMSGLGPRSDVNPVTGVFPFPYTTQGQGGDAIYKRLQVANADLDPALHPDASFYGEAHYIGSADAAAGNGHNNAGHREVLVGVLFNGGYELTFGDETVAGTPAIYAWQTLDPDVSITEIDVPGDGRLVLASLCADNGDGTWHYEYALYNHNSHRAVGAFGVPAGEAGSLTSVGFRDVDSHSGDLYGSADWTHTLGDGQVVWTTDTFDDDEHANALRWGTMYNFRFDAPAPPETAVATIGLFRPGAPDAVTVVTCGPGPLPLPGDLDGDGLVAVADLLLMLGNWGDCAAPCPPVCVGDIDRDCDVDAVDLLAMLARWTK